MYGDIIKEESHLEEPFNIPTTVDEIAQFLPGKSAYQDVDDLLIDIGGSHDRGLLRTAMAKIFQVAQRHIIDAENNRSQDLTDQIIDVVNAKRKSAQDAGVALEEEDGDFLNGLPMYNNDDEVINGNSGKILDNGSSTKLPRIKKRKKSRESSSETGSDVFVNGSADIADPDHVCPSCLPILGDEIIGTRPSGVGKDNSITTVHRSSCDIALKVRNQSKQSDTNYNTEDNNFNGNDGGNSLEVVDIVWDELYTAGEDIQYMAEIRLICNDRKLLLADCSEVVSDMSEIVKTGSLSTEEHAILNFLVKVKSLKHLQNLMNALSDIPSVMSVERNFGSDL